jgi:hypothetical protein
MLVLDIKSNQVDYLGIMGRPAFSLWGEERLLLSTLYEAYRPYNVRLENIVGAGTTDSAGDQGVTVNLGARTSFRFRFDRVDARMTNFLTSDLEALPGIIDAGVTALRSIGSEISFTSHIISEFSHSSLSQGRAEDFFRDVGVGPDLRLGESRGNGIIFHFDLPGKQWQVHLTIDHSLSIPGGIFLQYQIVIEADKVDYALILSDARQLLRTALSKIGLGFPDLDADST